MRAMVVEYPNDPACRYLDRQYMLGDSLLVAPVFSEDGVVDYYLPKGRWTSLLENRVVEGGQWRLEHVDFMHVPLFARENSIVPTTPKSDDTGWRAADELVLQLFELADGADITASAGAADSLKASPTGGQRTTFRCRRDGHRYSLERTAGEADHVRVLIRGCRAAVQQMSNARLMPRPAEGLLVEWIDPAAPLAIVLAEGVDLSLHRAAVKGAVVRASTSPARSS